jgi:hypothetical protein
MPKSLKTEIIQIILQHRRTEFKGIFVPFRKYNSKENLEIAYIIMHRGNGLLQY